MNIKKNIFLYMLFVFFSNLSIMVSFLSTYLSHLGLSVATISSVFLVYQSTKFVFELPTGFISDKYGKKISGIIGISLIIVSYILLLFSNGIIIIVYLSIFIQALGYTFITGSIESLFVNSIPANTFIKYNSVERLVYYSSLAISSVYGGSIIYSYGYNLSILFDIIALIITLLIICFMKEIKTSNSGEYSRTSKIKVKMGIEFIFSNHTLLALYLIDFANAFSFVGIEDLYALFLKQFSLQSNTIGIIIALQLVLSAVFGLFTTQLQKHIRNSILIYCFPLIRVFVTAPIYFIANTLWIIPVLYLFQLILYALYAPVKYQLFLKNTDQRYRATAFSFQSIMVSLGSILFFSLSSYLGNYFSLSKIILIALFITFLLIIIASSILYYTRSVDQ